MRRILEVLLLSSILVATAWTQDAEPESASERDQESDDTEQPAPAADEEDDSGSDDENYADADDEDFRPSEDIPADQSIAFPTDI